MTVPIVPLSKTEHGTTPCGPALRNLLDTAGERRMVAGNTPFLLNDPGAAWWLEQGRIELFLVETDNGRAHGARRHFTSIEPGTLLFGLDAADSAPAGFSLLAVPHVNTEVRRIDRAQLAALGMRPEQARDLAAPVDRWIEAVSEGLARWTLPGAVIHRSVQAGEAFSVKAGGRVTSAGGVLWLALPRATTLFLGTQDLPPGPDPCLFPLTQASWLHSGVDLSLSALDSAQAIAQGGLWQGLDALHELLLPTAELNLRLANVDEHNRLRRRAQSAQRDWQHGLDGLQGVLQDKRTRHNPPAAGAPPLALALEAIGRQEGFKPRMPARRRYTDDGETPSLEAIAQASGLRMRKVALEPGWEQADTQALLAYANDDGRPLAVLPAAGGAPTVYDPVHQQTLHGPQALALLSPEGVVFTAPLPFQPLNWASLPRFTIARAWRDLLTLVLSALCGGILGMAVPIASAYLIDTVIPGHDRNHLLQVAIILAVLGLAGFIMNYVGGIAFLRFQNRAGPALQAAIIDRLLRLPTGFFRRYSAGDLALRASAITHIEQLISGSAAQAVMGGVFAVFSFILLLYYDWCLSLWAALIILVYTCATVALIFLQLRRERDLARHGGELQSMVLQQVSGIAKIRLSASEDRAFTRWAKLFATAERLRASAAGYGNLQAALNGLFGLAALFVFFLVLGKFRNDGNMDMVAVGGFAAFLAAFGNFNSSVTQMTQTLGDLLAIQPLLERAMPILQATPEISDDKEDPGKLSGAVEFTHIAFRYQQGGPLVLDDVSISARPGEFIAIVGASGCGKSTLIRLLLGFETPESGGILLDGQDMRELDILAVRQQMGVVLQNSRPMPGSLFENIVGVSSGTLEQAWDAARQVGLAEDIENMPMGMHTVVSEGGGSLSGGQVQRLMIARAIVAQPRILILDEATSALDNRTQAVVTDSLDRLSATRIVVAHRLSTITRANRIYVMDAGRIVETGTFDQLMGMNGYFVRLAAAQLV
ncbi:MAG TPA: NHLP bacteriocin export ABC transporter permease/ATPase subunit [Burkholderiaceae bacterium]|nr:NHLP bacteriocin export ABC transporter permease/ATPase subunit [Burkholderiaceae bacterium]